MNASQVNNVLLFISTNHHVRYIDLLTTLAKYSLLPPQLKSKYTTNSKYKNPAVELLAKKYNIDAGEYNPKNKMKIINLKSQIKQFEEERRKLIEKKYTYLVFIKKLGISIATDLIKTCLNY